MAIQKIDDIYELLKGNTQSFYLFRSKHTEQTDVEYP